MSDPEVATLRAKIAARQRSDDHTSPQGSTFLFREIYQVATILSLLAQSCTDPSQKGVWSSMMRIAEPRWCKVARASPRMVTSSRPL